MPETVEDQKALESLLKAYDAAGGEYLKEHPDSEYRENLAAAEKRGLNLSADGDTAALREILKLGKRGHALVDYLTRKENFNAAHKLMSLKGKRAVEEVHRLAALLDRQGFGVTYDPTKVRAEDAYIIRRRMDIRSGKRRGRR